MLRAFAIFILALSLNSQLLAKDDNHCNCVQKRAQKSHFDFNRIPPYWFVMDSLACLELIDATKTFDQLDKDLLILRALNYTKEHFKTTLSQEEVRRPYSKILSDEQIDKLYTFLESTFPHRKLR